MRPAPAVEVVSTPLPPFARASMDRAAHRRGDPAWLDAAWAHPQSRALVVEGGRALVTDADELAWLPSGSAPPGERYFLGAPDPAQPVGYFAVAAPLPDPPPDGVRVVSLREVGGQLGDTDAGLFAHAAALEQWHARHPRCSMCGAQTEVALAGHVRHCPADGSEHHPRTDPAVIMLVTDDADRCLLGRQPSWPPTRMSTLAGYVEAGETLENAVIREVAEEVGIMVEHPRYVASQPWPFPSSLMLAFTARATATEVCVDGVEIEEAKWFSRDELRHAVAGGVVRLPMAASVAFFLIDRWFGGGLADLVGGAKR